ncbi:hypothetical protein BV22DRAFT_1108849 [Leucogyrophana mollusca]|uniref:Uncharacterized protein n=1 Tax=Leucogyrophana mollusca TaxID=85980 RepID=A0ACB8BYB6_9AGAM|nr:hypothetical protein BV22DRAFT_1108849 [Leucogyrophana mollusca]
MASNESGIVAWMSSIRASMTNDPCRQLFEDQIQNHGFIFLDDYLDNILTGPTQGPIIELVKTPGRKKTAPRRTRAATTAAAKAKNVISLSLEEDGGSKENFPPVNSFHKALLQAKQNEHCEDALQHRTEGQAVNSQAKQSAKLGKHDKPKSVTIADTSDVDVSIQSNIPELMVSSPSRPEIVSHAGFYEQPGVPSQSEALDVPFQEHGNELSVIAEGDESPERSRNIVRQQSPTLEREDYQAPLGLDLPSQEDDQGVRQLSAPASVPEDDEPVAEVANITASSSSNIFQSVSLDSPEPSRPVPVNTEHHTAPLASIPTSPKVTDRDALTAPLPTIPPSHPAPVMTTMIVPIHDSPPRTLAHKSSVPQFPSLPVPSPLRKSMRVAREPSMGTGVLPAASAPAPAALGKRTSWLMKAREVKAMEVTSGRSSTLGAIPTGLAGTSAMVGVPGLSNGIKRKSGEMLGTGTSNMDKNDDERKAKSAKTSVSDAHPTKNKPQGDLAPAQVDKGDTATSVFPAVRSEPAPVDSEDHLEPLNDDSDEGLMGRFKRTVEGLGARAGKSMGKSLGGGVAAAAALAEARAAAEARVAERNKPKDQTPEPSPPSPPPNLVLVNAPQDNAKAETPLEPASRPSRESERRLSLSDLVLGSENRKQQTLQDPSKGRTSEESATARHVADESTSTTPPNSPPSTRNSSFVLPSGPVFNKKPPPPPVFMPPAQKQAPLTKATSKDFSFNLPVSTAFSLPAPMSLGVPARLGSPSSTLRPQTKIQPLSNQSSQASVFSDAVFDRVSDTPAWMPSTQETEYSSAVDSQPQAAPAGKVIDIDDDDSWPLEEKLAAANQGWTPFNFNAAKEDSMTWSTLPTESQRGDTGPRRSDSEGRLEKQTDHSDSVAPNLPGTFQMDVDHPQKTDADAFSDAEDESVMDTSDLDEMALEPGQSTVNLVDKSGIPRSQSQLSMASTASSSQSQAGFFSQASKLVNTMLGGSKKGKPEVKSLQLAAAAAKKQQEEMDKKATRLKEMENRRQLVIQRKADEEKTRLLEEEKKLKEEGERRKREREEHTDKRPLKATTSKKPEDDTTKKRKIVVETEKKEVKKPPSKDKKDTLPASKLAKSSLATPATKMTAVPKSVKQPPPTAALASSATYNASQNIPAGSSSRTDVKVTKIASSIKGKGKAKSPEEDMSDKLPSQVLQTQMAARAKAQMQAAKQSDVVPSESIELPDINSEYSDSEDEDRVRTFDPPDWAQSPELRQALQMQSTVNPDDIFGAIRPLRMEEMFRTRQSRFRARTSSANWSGTDRLTIEEEREYVRRMGFQ